MIRYTTAILKFDEQGEKTGWTYIVVPAAIAAKLKPGHKKSFRVKGFLDDFAIKGISLLPMGEGEFIMALKAALRKGIRKRHGDTLTVQLAVDETPLQLPEELLACLEEEPEALTAFKKMPPSHQRYFGNWIEQAKGEATKTKRIAHTINALLKGFNYGQMIRTLKASEIK